MRRQSLQDLLTAKRERRPVVLAINLDNNSEFLLDPSQDMPGPAGLADAVLQALNQDRSGLAEIGGQTWFLRVSLPAVAIVVVGAVHIAQAMVPLARQLGYRLTIVDPREAFARADRFPDTDIVVEWPDIALAQLSIDPRTAIVTLTHDPKLDDAALIPAVQSDVFYIGALGSKKTQAARRERLARAGLSAAAIARINGPVGLDIGAQTPSEIALSIIAQISSVLRGGVVR